jgi:hypothetical protein
MELLGDVGHMESRFDLFSDSVRAVEDWRMVCIECTVGSEIVLEAPDGTPR